MLKSIEHRLFSLVTTLVLRTSIGLVSLAAGIPANVDAQENNSEYRSIVQTALSEFDLGHWDEARALFERAHAIKPSARTLRGLGLVAFEQRLYIESIDYLVAALVRSLGDTYLGSGYGLAALAVDG